MIVKTHILDLPYQADNEYDYLVPEKFVGITGIGSLVSVGFGKGNRSHAAIVTGIAEESGYPDLKSIISVADDVFSLNAEMLGMCNFLKERTLCSIGEAVQTVLPTGAVASLFRNLKNPIERYYKKNTVIQIKVNGTAQKKILDFMGEGEYSETLIKTKTGASLATLKSLVTKGILSVREQPLYRNPYSGHRHIPDNSVLNGEQTAAAEKLLALAQENKPNAAMLFGVTGSGKTRVIKAVADKVIESGKSVIMLVPEISLTGQTVDYFCSSYGERVAVIHSGLSDGEKLDAYRRIKAGEVDLVIGTRSAVFAPLDNLGMIVIDEEQEHTYKSDMNPKYHTVDAARYRAARNNLLMVVASATPSLESYSKAKAGIYSLVTLKGRYGDAVLPDVIIADLSAENARKTVTPVSDKLKCEIEKNLAANEQTILFVNRRGYNNFVTCQKCGEVITCPHCSVSLTYHLENGTPVLKCHYCGHYEAVPDKCPKCSSEHLSRRGFGTQLVAEELNELFPTARILRLDADTTGAKFSHETILAKFRNGEADILIGTQMVTKGHNFPNVTLVGVINADSALYLDDFRATEKTFALLTQVIGRAGRAAKKGRAVIQTFSPQNETIRLAARQNYDKFYSGAITLRKQLVFPPYCDFALLSVSGEDEPLVLEMTVKLNKRLKELLDTGFNDVKVFIFGPFEAPVYKVNDSYRMRIIIKCKLNKRTRELLSLLLCEFSKGGKAALSVDLNPSSM